MAVTTTNLGVITAYGDAVAAGYTGTKAEWQALMASYATVGQQAVDAKNDAVAAKNTAVSKATEATTAASTATTKANEASASAQSIAESAAQIQENTDDIDQLKSNLNFIDNEINNNIGTLPYFSLCHGGLVKTNNKMVIDTSYTTIVCTGAKPVIFDYDITITPKSGFRFGVIDTDADGNWLDNTGWITEAYTISAGQYVGISFRRVTDAGAVDIPAFMKNYEITPSFVKVIYDRVLRGVAYVDATNGDDSTGNGTPSAPYATIGKALSTEASEISVSPDTYSETITVEGKNNVHIFAEWNNFVSGSVTERPKIIIDGNNSVATALTIQNCLKVVLEDVVVQNCTNDGALINLCQDIDLQNCEFHSNGRNGVTINYSNGVVRDCKANYNGNDGFNMNYFGDTQFYNCSGHDNGDDGISHHQGTTGCINGGEWYNNGKGGVASPAHGSQVDILNVYCHNNAYGIYANADSDTVARTFRVWNSVLVNNSQYGLTSKRNTCYLYNCKISGNTVGQTTAPSGGHIYVLD